MGLRGGGGVGRALQRCWPLAGKGVGVRGVMGERGSARDPLPRPAAGDGCAPKVPVGVWVGDVCREPCTVLHVTGWESQSLLCPRIARLGGGRWWRHPH